MPRATRPTGDDLIQEIASNTRLEPILLDYLARKEFRSPFKRSSNYKNMISSLSGEALAKIYDIFVRSEIVDKRPGVAQEWKLANYMLQNPVSDYIEKKTTQIKIDYPLPAKAGGRTHKIDVVLLDKNDTVLALGEAKATGKPVSKEDLAKWFDILDEYLDSSTFLALAACYYLSLSDYKEDALRTIREHVPDFDKNGWGYYKRKRGFLSKNEVFLKIIEERGGKFYDAFRH